MNDKPALDPTTALALVDAARRTEAAERELANRHAAGKEVWEGLKQGCIVELEEQLSEMTERWVDADRARIQAVDALALSERVRVAQAVRVKELTDALEAMVDDKVWIENGHLMCKCGAWSKGENRLLLDHRDGCRVPAAERALKGETS